MKDLVHKPVIIPVLPKDAADRGADSPPPPLLRWLRTTSWWLYPAFALSVLLCAGVLFLLQSVPELAFLALLSPALFLVSAGTANPIALRKFFGSSRQRVILYSVLLALLIGVGAFVTWKRFVSDWGYSGLVVWCGINAVFFLLLLKFSVSSMRGGDDFPRVEELVLVWLAVMTLVGGPLYDLFGPPTEHGHSEIEHRGSPSVAFHEGRSLFSRRRYRAIHVYDKTVVPLNRRFKTLQDNAVYLEDERGVLQVEQRELVEHLWRDREKLFRLHGAQESCRCMRREFEGLLDRCDPVLVGWWSQREGTGR